MNTKIVSVDFQKEFTAVGGLCYKPRPSVDFVKNVLLPFVAQKRIRIAEIISDYRQPRPGDRGDCCRPGESGYESEIPISAKEKNVWVKCMNSPIWVRDNIGEQAKIPGIPYQNPDTFNDWVSRVIGRPHETEILLIGLTLDCCVLCTAQEFTYRGYAVKILNEAVDTYSGNQAEKALIYKTPVENWAGMIQWSDAQKILS